MPVVLPPRVWVLVRGQNHAIAHPRANDTARAESVVLKDGCDDECSWSQECHPRGSLSAASREPVRGLAKKVTAQAVEGPEGQFVQGLPAGIRFQLSRLAI